MTCYDFAHRLSTGNEISEAVIYWIFYWSSFSFNVRSARLKICTASWSRLLQNKDQSKFYTSWSIHSHAFTLSLLIFSVRNTPYQNAGSLQFWKLNKYRSPDVKIDISRKLYMHIANNIYSIFLHTCTHTHTHTRARARTHIYA